MNPLDRRALQLNQYIERMIHNAAISHCCCLDDLSSRLNVQELNTIRFLGMNGPSIMREIAEYLMLAVSTMTGVVDSLVEKKLVSRERSDNDRRIVCVALTDSGKEAYCINLENHVKLSRGLLEALDDDEQETLLILLGKISGK